MADLFFVRRDGRVKGPLTRERLRDLRRQDRLRLRDEIAVAADGPWSPLRDVYDQVLPDEEPAAAADDFWREELPPDASAAGERRQDGRGAPGVDRLTWFERLRELLEGDGAFREPFRPWSFLAAAVPLAALAAVVAVILVSPALEPARRGPLPAALPPPADPAAGGPSAAPAGVAEPGAAGAAGDDGVPAAAVAEPGRISAVDPEHEAAIAALLGAYYAAGDWQARSRLVVPGERTRRLLQQLDAGKAESEGNAAGPPRWSLVRRLEPGKLAAAARSGQPVLVETSVDDHAHAVYVVFVEGRWRVDWLRSLERLWLTL